MAKPSITGTTDAYIYHIYVARSGSYDVCSKIQKTSSIYTHQKCYCWPTFTSTYPQRIKLFILLPRTEQHICAIKIESRKFVRLFLYEVVTMNREMPFN